MKKGFLVSLILILCVGLLAGCSSNNKSEGSSIVYLRV